MEYLSEFYLQSLSGTLEFLQLHHSISLYAVASTVIL